MKIYSATHLLPVSSPPMQDGAVAVDDDRIVAVGARQDLAAQFGQNAEVRDLGRAVVLPGLINAHTHLELSWLGDDSLPLGDYVAWLRELLRRRTATDLQVAIRAAEQAIQQAVERGTVAIGDVSNECWVAPLIARSPLAGVLFHELYGLSTGSAEASLEQAVEHLQTLAGDADVVAAADRLSIALTPHAPHTTSVALLRALAGRAAAASAPLSIHVAETNAEARMLEHGDGRLVELFRERGFLGADWSPPGRRSVEHLKRLGVLTPRTLAVHCVHLDHHDHSVLQSTGTTVVTCPRSNAALGVGKAPVPALLREGIPVALGTDSLASAPDLDMFAEMAALVREHPGLSPAAVLRMATLNGARALGLGKRLGSIEVGKQARLAVVPLPEGSPNALEAIFSAPPRVYDLDGAARIAAEPSP